MIQLLAHEWTYRSLRIVGFGLFVGYLLYAGDYSFSIVWVAIYVIVSVLIAWSMVRLHLSERFPALNRYYFRPLQQDGQREVLSENAWTKAYAQYLASGMRGYTMLFAPAEDGLICVPILVAGINPLSAILGGIAFGLLHVGRFTYLECIGKSIIYSVVCFYILPHGLLTVVGGHFMLNLLAFAGVTAALRSRALNEPPEP